MWLGIVPFASLLASLPPLVQLPRLTKTRFQETAVNIRREMILKVQWGESMCTCKFKHLPHRSWTVRR